MMRLVTISLTALLAFAAGELALPAQVSAQEEDEGEQTKRTHSVSAPVFEKLEEAQKASDEKDYGKALSILKELLDGELTDYERANTWNFLGMVHYEQENMDAAIDAFRKVVDQEDIPEGMRISTLTNLAQLYMAEEQYQASIDTLKRLYAVVDEPSADQLALEAQAHFQLGNHDRCVSLMLEAMRTAKQQEKEYKENWLAVLRAAYYEQDQYEQAAKVLKLLVRLYPKKEYWVQLAGMYGLLDQERKQLGAMEAAWEQELLDREQELVSLAQLMMRQDVPYKAWQVLEKGMEQGIVEEDVDNLRLLAQAMAMAHETEKQIPVLRKAAQKADDGEIFLYLGQAYMDLADWEKAAEALEDALAKGLKRPGAARLMLGTAYFNMDRFDQAREAFREAKEYEDNAESAKQWIEYVNAEEKRRQYIAEAGAAAAGIDAAGEAPAEPSGG